MIITLSNQKGGCGKSSTAVSLATGLRHRGYKTLLVDTDPQASASDTYQADQSKPSIHDVFNGTDIRTAIQRTKVGDIVAGSLEMSAADMTYTKQGREFILRKQFEAVKGDYDYIIIDTPPALGIITINALTAADKVIIPVQADRYSINGIAQLHDTIQTVREYSNPKLEIDGILLTRYNNRTILSRDMTDNIGEISTVLRSKVYTATIRQSVVMQEAQAMQCSVFAYQPDSTVAQDYSAFIKEFMGGVRIG